MEKHSSHITKAEAGSPETPKYNPRLALSPEMQNLQDIAERYYSPLKDKVVANDNSQEFFTSGAENFLNGLELTSKMASRATKPSHSSN